MPKSSKQKGLLFVPLGGSSEIGMNLNLYCCDGKWLMIDLGASFAGETLPGIDLILPDMQYIKDRKDDLLALVLTHGHEDHIGAVVHLWRYLECPVYATPFTATLLQEKFKEHHILDEVPLHIIATEKPFKLGPFSISYVPLAHSIAEGNGLKIMTKYGTVFHTGDWKLDPKTSIADPATETVLKKIGRDGVLAMVGDSTNVFNKKASGSEQDLKPHLKNLIARKKGRVVITTFASNVERLESIGEIAHETGRHLVTMGRSMKRVIKVAKECGYLKQFPPVLNEKDAGSLPKDKLLVLCTGCQGEIRAALNNLADDNNKKLSLSTNDTVIFSSKIIPGNERAVLRVINKLVLRKIEVITERDDFVHVSGHPGEPELIKMYDWIRPEIAIPVHGDAHHIHAHAALAESLQIKKVFRPKNGILIKLAPGKPHMIDEVEAGYVVLDGNRLLSLSSNTLSERRRMMENGSLSVAVSFQKANGSAKLAAVPIVQAFGVLCLENDISLREHLDQLIMAEISTWEPKSKKDASHLEEELRLAILRLFRHETGKKPLISVKVAGFEE